MGMYTEFVFGCSLKEDVPEKVVEILQAMLDDNAGTLTDLPDHPLFKTDRWKFMLNSASYYFGFSEANSKLVFDKIGNNWLLSIRCNLKNYCDEIQEFIDWIKPYVEDGSGERSFLGYSLYETDQNPTLYFLV